MNQNHPSLGSFPFGQKIVWQPNPEWINASNLAAFMQIYGIKNFDQLLHQSTTDIEWFWEAVLKDLDIQFFKQDIMIKCLVNQ